MFYPYTTTDSDEETESHKRFRECVLVFETNYVKELFKEYALNNWEHKEKFFDNIWLSHFPEIESYIMEEFEK